MVKRRNNRQDAIRDIVRGKSIRTQRALVDELQAIGFNCTQATVSRDIADMGLRKLSEGIYVLAEDLHLQRMVSEFVMSVDRADNLVVIKSQPGTAPGVAAAVDAASLPEVKGSVAGNDTVSTSCATQRSSVAAHAASNVWRPGRGACASRPGAFVWKDATRIAPQGEGPGAVMATGPCVQLAAGARGLDSRASASRRQSRRLLRYRFRLRPRHLPRLRFPAWSWSS